MGTYSWVRIIGREVLVDFIRRHATARKRLDYWQRVVRAAAWKNFLELRRTFRSADAVDDKIVFNIGGNNYRLVAMVDFTRQTLLITKVMTHAEYDKKGIA